MNFASNYTEAYQLLRAGRVDRELWDRVMYGDYEGNYDARRNDMNALRGVRVHALGRVKAAIYALKMAKEMRRQRSLMTVLFDIKEEQSAQIVNQRPINLFPVTVNRTTVQMRDPDKGPNA